MKVKYDCLIVLANEMNKSGVLNKESLDRITLGISLFKKFKIKKLITCGWDYRKDSILPISVAMKKLCLDNGILEDSIYTDLLSRDTVGDAYFTKVNFVEKNNWKNILVVTSDYHARRTMEIFKFVYGSDYSIRVMKSNTDKDNNNKSEINSLFAFRKTFKNIKRGDNKLIYNTLINKHPFYNGDKFSKFK